MPERADWTEDTMQRALEVNGQPVLVISKEELAAHIEN